LGESAVDAQLGLVAEGVGAVAGELGQVLVGRTFGPAIDEVTSVGGYVSAHYYDRACPPLRGAAMIPVAGGCRMRTPALMSAMVLQSLHGEKAPREA
jgi:hypothetical protein